MSAWNRFKEIFKFGDGRPAGPDRRGPGASGASPEKSGRSDSDVRTWFSRKTYAAPFGVYEGSTPAEEPDNENLVGRESQRARLLTLLFNTNRRGAYLVTGHRGSGKTTFVNFCLEEYKHGVYDRFLSANVGRAYLWDRLGLCLILVLSLFLAVLLHETLAFLLAAPSQHVLVWLAVVLLTLLGLYPIFVSAVDRVSLVLYRASTVFNGFMEPRLAKKNGKPGVVSHLVRHLVLFFTGEDKPNLRPAFYLGFVAVFVWLALPSLSPAEAMAELFLLGGWLFFTANFVGLFRVEDRVGSFLLALLLGIPFFWFVNLEGVHLFLFDGIPKVESGDLLHQPLLVYGALGVFLVSLGLAILSVQQIGSLRRWRKYKSRHPGAISRQLEQTREAIESASNWHLLVALVSGSPSAIALVRHYEQIPADRIVLLVDTLSYAVGNIKAKPLVFWILCALILPLVAIALINLLGLKSDQSSRPDILLGRAAVGSNSQPVVLMIMKSFLLVLISLQVVFPLFATLQEDLIAPSFVETWALENSMAWLAAHGARGGASNIGGFELDSLFTAGLAEILPWVLSVISAMLLVVFLEYEWIIRAQQFERGDSPLRRSSVAPPPTHMKSLFELGPARTYHRRLLEQTFFFRVYGAWLPVLFVHVNLGFDTLDHRRVVEAMLTGLRESFKNLFFRWSSATNLVIWGTSLLAVLWVTAHGSNHWFGLDLEHREALENKRLCRTHAPETVLLLQRYKGEEAVRLPPGMELACYGGELPAQALQWRIFSRDRAPRSDDGDPTALRSGTKPASREAELQVHVLAWFFPEADVWEQIPALRVHHVLTFLVVFFVPFWYLRRKPILPYRRILNEIEDLLASLSGRRKEELRYHPAIIPRLVSVFTGEDRVKNWESEPFDPRTVEISVMKILTDIQDPTIHFPHLARHRVNLPTPEIVFKFDELDKLGIGVIPPHESSGPESRSVEGSDQERQRSQALRTLFADLKNLISAGAARFIFVGGRNLHDEWMADQTSRRPLLTNIFDAEIYLPSLLVDDDPEQGEREIGKLVRQYLQVQTEHALRRNRRLLLQRFRPWLTPWMEQNVEPAFVQLPPKDGAMDITRCGRANLERPKWSDAFQKDFEDFLCYRSRGNVKKLRAALEQFVQPTQRIMNVGEAYALLFDCQHVLRFRDVDRFRIQLIAEIYRRIISAFEPRIHFRDDRLVVGLLYVADFLLKFHRRAFAWSGIQRVDELSHVHRAPDLPKGISDLMQAWSEKYLHSIRNGMYDYRFNSDFAQELQYLSRRSEEELAALNFTLDESQALKAIYRARIDALKGESSAYEFVAALGELHDFDNEFEVARHYYSRAMEMLDEQFHKQVAKKRGKPAVYEVLSRSEGGLNAARRRIAWGITRLRLKLHVGMTYERARDLEQAQAHYRNARTLASAIMRALLHASKDSDGEGLLPFYSPDMGKPDYVSTLKNLNLLFQPAFAEAWVGEKVRSGVDTSVRLIERSLWELRWSLPLVREEFDPGRKPGVMPEYDVFHPNFCLIMAEQHNKAGDLMFFKSSRTVAAEQAVAAEGFMLRAQYHYAISLHEVRFFNRCRRHLMESHLFPGRSGEPGATTRAIVGESSEFVARTSAGSLADLGETLLTRVSLSGLSKLSGGGNGDSGPGRETIKEGMEKIFEHVRAWLEDADDDGEPWSELVGEVFGVEPRDTKLADWLGSPMPPEGRGLFEFKAASRKAKLKRFQNLADSRVENLVSLETSVEAPDPLWHYLVFSLSAAKVLERGGFHEEAARRVLRVVETIQNYLWWFSIQRVLRGEPGGPETGLAAVGGELPTSSTTRWPDDNAQAAGVLLRRLLPLAVLALDWAAKLFERSRSQMSCPGDYKVGRRMPTQMLSLACSLALAAEILPDGAASVREELDELAKMIRSWTSRCSEGSASATAKWFREQLVRVLDYNAYPLSGRLHNLKVLVDDFVVRAAKAESRRLVECEVPWSEPQPGQPAALWYEDLEEAMKRLAELLELEDTYEGPLHFTPLQSGITCSLFYLLLKHAENEVVWAVLGEAERTRHDDGTTREQILPRCCGDLDQLGQLARSKLIQSREMVSMQEAYYHAISDLYYLYDDFNDRRIHYNHAIQVAASELAEPLIEILGEKLDRGPGAKGSEDGDAESGCRGNREPAAAPEEPPPTGGSDSGQ